MIFPGPHRKEEQNPANLVLSTVFFPPTRPCSLSCTQTPAKAPAGGLSRTSPPPPHPTSGSRIGFRSCLPQLHRMPHVSYSSRAGPSRKVGTPLRQQTRCDSASRLEALGALGPTLNSNLEIVKEIWKDSRKEKGRQDGKKSKYTHGCVEK